MLTPVVFCILASVSLSSYAGATNADNNTTDNGRSTVVAPSSETQNMANDRSDLNDRDSDDNDYSWIGLFGLLGLAGLMKRDRTETNRPLAR